MSHLNLKNKRASKTAIGIAMCAFSAALVSGVGLSAWVIAGGVSGGSAQFSADAGVVEEKDYKYLYPNAVSATEPLQYNDYGLVYNDDIGTVGHVVYHLIFDPTIFLQTISASSSNTYFDFSLAYKEYKSGYTLIDNYLSCSTKVWDSTTTYIADGTALAISLSNHVANGGTSGNTISITSSSRPIYVNIDYKFDVGSNFSTVKSNELSNSVVFLLTAKVVFA
jgi:hypothetical protein